MSSLMILRRVMEKIRDTHGLPAVPRPCEYFNLIGGTSTGGYLKICSRVIQLLANRRADLSQSCLVDWA
jgi:patatin-like phospholipase/acyl hydrolase